MTNSVDKNEVLSYIRSGSGALTPFGAFATGGRGSGGTIDPLGSQGSLILNSNHCLLFAVNAASGTVSMFRVEGASLSLLKKVHSGGSAPNALALSNGLLYVLNSGGSSNVTGFQTTDEGTLTPIPQSTRYLSTGLSAASSLAFTPDGRFLVVTERLTNKFDVFTVMPDGTLSTTTATSDPAPGTFSVSFAPNGTMLVTETGPASAVNGSTISSFVLETNGTLLPVSTGVPTLGAATCWDAVTPNGRYVYTSNSGSGSISGYSIGSDGSLHLLAQTLVATLPAGATNLDLAITGNGKYLYSLNAGTGMIGVFAINEKNGALYPLNEVGGLTAKGGLNGIAAY